MTAQEHALTLVRRRAEDSLIAFAKSEDPDLTEEQAQDWVSNLVAEGQLLDTLHHVADVLRDLQTIRRLHHA